jgi:hypothetical protein
MTVPHYANALSSPLLFANTQVALLGFLGVMGLSALSASGSKEKVAVATTAAASATDGDEEPPSTPKRTPRKKKAGEDPTGTVFTPSGRRSARIMRRKED